jgi:hypothetical protein
VTLKSGYGCVDVSFGSSELFSFVEEAMRCLLSETLNSQTVH